MAEAAPERQRFLTFRADERLYALPAREIVEVIRVPPAARLPHGPASLLGLANLRGSVLPLVGLRSLTGRAETKPGPAARAIVLDGMTAALVVDAVEALAEAEPSAAAEAELAAGPGEMLRGAFEAGPDRVARILDIQPMLAAAFTRRARPDRATPASAPLPARQAAESNARPRMLVSFEVAGQEYALEMESVREIIRPPEAMAAMPHADAPVLGMAAFRDALLPLLSLRGLLGFPAGNGGGRAKVIAAMVAGAPVGLLADRMRVVIAADPARIEPVPPVLVARAGGEARIKAVYRGERGRLIPILAPDQLFREDVMRRIGQTRPAAREEGPLPEAGHDEALFLVFGLGKEEFALPIGAVEEVANPPAQVTRLPRAPDFLEGVTNLRGDVLPVVDQRRRFGLPPFEGGQRRMIVLRAGKNRAGLIVDAVSEVLRVPAEAVEPAPDPAGEAPALVQGVINLGAAGRMVLVLEPGELLAGLETGPRTAS